MKQVIVVNEALALPPGKMAAQVAHAAVGALLNAPAQKQSAWFQAGMPKVVLRCASEAELFELARQAQAAGADYVAFGAVYPSPTKPHAVRAPLALFARCRAELGESGIGSCAIGGNTLDNAPTLVAAGADLIAVISDLFTAPDIGARAAQFSQLYAGERS